MEVQNLGAAGLPNSGPFLYTGADVSWELLGTQPERVGYGTMDVLFWGHHPGGKTHVNVTWV